MSFKDKYLKYKYKYLELKQRIEENNMTNSIFLEGGAVAKKKSILSKSSGSVSPSKSSRSSASPSKSDSTNKYSYKKIILKRTPTGKITISKLIYGIKTYIMNLIKPELEREIITDFEPFGYIYDNLSDNYLLTFVQSNDDEFINSILDPENTNFIIFQGTVLIPASTLIRSYKNKYASLEKEELQRIVDFAKTLDGFNRSVFIEEQAALVADKVNNQIDELGSAEYSFEDWHITSIVIKNPKQHPFDRNDGYLILRNIDENKEGNLILLIDIIREIINTQLDTSYLPNDFDIHITENNNGIFGTLLVNPDKKLNQDEEKILSSILSNKLESLYQELESLYVKSK